MAILIHPGNEPQMSFETAPLDRNWRSDQRIMALANALNTGLFGDDYAELAAQNPVGRAAALEVTCSGLVLLRA